MDGDAAHPVSLPPGRRPGRSGRGQHATSRNAAQTSDQPAGAQRRRTSHRRRRGRLARRDGGSCRGCAEGPGHSHGRAAEHQRAGTPDPIAIPAGAPSDRPQNVTSALLTLMSAQGRIVRSTPTGSWTSRHHRWEPVEHWWPDGLPELGIEASQRALAHSWLERFGPATADDLQWWTGWNKTTVRRALSGLPIEEVDLHGQTGIALSASEALEDDPGDQVTATPVATLLPSLDPTPMGWKRRDWFLRIDHHHVFDRNGNIGPTLWWDGEIIGSWAISSTGELPTTVLADRGTAADAAVEFAAGRLHERLHGTVVTPAIRAPLERSLVRGGAEPLSDGAPQPKSRTHRPGATGPPTAATSAVAERFICSVAGERAGRQGGLPSLASCDSTPPQPQTVRSRSA